MRKIAPLIVMSMLLAMMGCSTAQSLTQVETDEPSVGFWVRLTYDDATDALMWDQLEQAGTTDLFIETFYHGFVIYPDSEEFEQRPELAGQDPLSEALEQAAQRGIRVHAWIECFQWGPDYERFPQIPQNRYVDTQPSWLCRTIEGEPHSSFYLSPAHPEVQAKVTGLIEEILTHYPDVAGINLDYIRWPEAHECWYDEANIALFIDAGGDDPRENRRVDNMDAFLDHTAAQVTHVVEESAAIIDRISPDVILSAAFFAGSPDSEDTRFKAQDWPTWMESDLLDVGTPMCYSNSLVGLRNEALRVITIADESAVEVWVGLAVKADTPHPPAVDQFDSVAGRGADGVVIFSHGWVAEQPEEFEQIGDWLAENDL